MSKDSKFSNYNLDAASDEKVWKKYFDKIACYYVHSFFENLETIRGRLAEIYEARNNPEQVVQNHLDLREIKNYYRAYEALLPQSDGTIQVDKKIIDKFKEIKNSPTNQAVTRLNLKNIEIEGQEVSLNQLMNFMISFYKRADFRRRFFSKIKVEENESLVDRRSENQENNRPNRQIYPGIIVNNSRPRIYAL